MKSCQQVRRPLVGLALSMVVGLYLQQCLKPSALLVMGLAACTLSLAAGCRRARSSGVVYLAVVLLAAVYGAVESFQIPVKSVLPIAEVLASQQEIVGTVADDPKIFEADAVSVFKFRVEAVCFEDGWRPTDFFIRVRGSDINAPVAYGECWHLTGRFRSYETVYNGIAGTFYTDSNGAVRIRASSSWLRNVCYQLRHRAASVLCRGLKAFPEQVHLLQALLLGYRHELPDNLYNIFSRTGTLHIFAISGLHVGVMAAILIAALKVLGISKPGWGLFLIPLLFFYVVSTGMKPSAFRAFTMAAVYFAAPLVHRRSDTVSAIALAAIILLVINPFQLNNPGFLLSFTVVCGIVMVHLYMARQLNVVTRPGRIVWARLGGPRPISVFWRTIGMLTLTSFAAWLFSAPLTAGFFNTFSPVALAGNLIIIPLTFMIVLAGCFSLLVAPLSLSASVVFNHAARVFVTLLINIIHWIGKIPGAYRFVRAPSFWVLVFWYGGLVLVFSGPERCRKYGLLSVLYAALVWALGLYPALFRPHHAIEVSRDAGFSMMISENSMPQVLAVKGDSYSLSRAGRFLKRNGVNRLPELAVSDSQLDVDAIHELCRTFSVGCLRLPLSFQGVPTVQKLAHGGDCIVFSDNLTFPAGSGKITLVLNR